jgi:hypothetical protein
MGDVVGPAGNEIVESDDVMAVGEKAVAEVRSEESGGTGDENSHITAARPIEM